MLKDLTRDDWIKFLGIPEDRIPQVLILRGTRNLKKHYSVQRELFDNVLDIGSPNSILDDLLMGDLNRFGVVIVLDQATEYCRTRDVAALANIDE